MTTVPIKAQLDAVRFAAAEYKDGPDADAMRAAVKTLNLVARFETEIRQCVTECLERDRLAVASDLPEVQAVLDQFPGASVVGVRNV